MSIKQEDLEAAGRLVGEELARTDLDWGAWNEEHKGEGGGSKGDGGSKGGSKGKADEPKASPFGPKPVADPSMGKPIGIRPAGGFDKPQNDEGDAPSQAEGGKAPKGDGGRTDVEDAMGVKFDDAASKTIGVAGLGQVTNFVKAMPKGSDKAIISKATASGFKPTVKVGAPKSQTTLQHPNGNIVTVQPRGSGKFQSVLVSYYQHQKK